MFCPNCGTTNPDTNLWCKFCGSSLQATPPEPVYQPPVPPLPLNSCNTSRDALKKAATGPMFLTAIILYAVSLILALIYSVSGTYTTNVLDVYRTMGLDLSYEQLEQTMNSSMLTSQIISAIPSLLTILGLVLILVSARKAQPDHPISTAGFTILQVLNIIALVLMSLCALVILVMLVAVIVTSSEIISELGSQIPSDFSAFFDLDTAASSYVNFGELIVTVLIILCVVMLAILALYITYIAFVLRSLNAAKDVCRYGSTRRKPAFIVALMCFLIGGSSVLSAFSALISTPFSFGMVLSILTTGTSGAAMFMFGLTLLSFRSLLPKPQPVSIPYPGSYPPPAQLPQWDNMPQ